MKTFVILENIRSAHNVGAIFRTADGAGVSKIYIVGYTPSPKDRFDRVQPEIAKTSLGASATVPWEKHKDIQAVLAKLKQEGIKIVAVEQTSNSETYIKGIPGDVAFVFGNEVDGVSAAALEAADHIIEIPMSGEKESLNVSTTAGVILFNHRDH